ncbi:unnamed protein product [Chrysoparadoxa australica]
MVEQFSSKRDSLEGPELGPPEARASALPDAMPGWQLSTCGWEIPCSEFKGEERPNKLPKEMFIGTSLEAVQKALLRSMPKENSFNDCEGTNGTGAGSAALDPNGVSAQGLGSAGGSIIGQSEAQTLLDRYNLLITRLKDRGEEVAEVYSRRSTLLCLLGKFNQARSDAQTAIELDHQYAAGYYRLGCAQVGLGDLNAAIEAFSAGLKLSPSNVPMRVISCPAAISHFTVLTR